MSLNVTRNNENCWTARKSLLRVCLAVGLTVLGTVFLKAEEMPLGADDSRPASFEPAEITNCTSSVFNGNSNALNLNGFDFDRSFHIAENLRLKDPDKPRTPALERFAKTNQEEELSDAEKIRLRLTHRYGNPVVARFIENVSTDRSLKLYSEISKLIDSRHIAPSSYKKRSQHAVTNLLYAVGNRAFLQANRISPTRSQVSKFRSSLQRLAAARPVRTSSDALNLIYATMNLASRQLNLKPTSVTLEFVYGSAESLDKYSSFAPEAPSRRPSASLEDHVVGIGVEIKPHDDGVLVVKALRGGPAAATGLKGGDIIASINGKSLKGRSLDYAVDLIAGSEGSRIFLGIRRNGQLVAPMEMTRRRVTIHSVSEVRMLDTEANVGYIKLDKFAKSSSKEMDTALWDLYRKGMTSMVIDLRGNPGGLLTTAIELSNKFLPCGSIVSTRGRNRQDQSAEQASYDRTWKVPLAVLVDENSASASEIFAAAIQENGRGLIVGRKSYGKGTVQTHFPLSTVSGNLRLTTARFFSPKGRVMAGAGVTPDITVSAVETVSFVDFDNDEDIRAALAATKSDRAKSMAKAKSGCRNRNTRDYPL